MRRIDLKEVQALELEALIHFDELCSKHDINYSIIGGTLLGAVRHKGFIPWDDDVDVFVSRPDYDKLANLTYLADKPRVSMPHYRFVGPDHGTFYPWIRMVDTRTHTELKYLHDSFGTNALFIDIFPVDGMPADNKVREKHIKKIARMRAFQHLYFSKPGTDRTPLKTIVKCVAEPIVRTLIKPGAVVNMIESEAKKYPYESSYYVGGAVISDFKQGFMEKSAFEDAVLLDFEGHQFKAMSCWDKWLTDRFGDYMTPVEDYGRHHIAIYLDD